MNVLFISTASGILASLMSGEDVLASIREDLTEGGLTLSVTDLDAGCVKDSLLFSEFSDLPFTS